MKGKDEVSAGDTISIELENADIVETLAVKFNGYQWAHVPLDGTKVKLVPEKNRWLV